MAAVEAKEVVMAGKLATDDMVNQEERGQSTRFFRPLGVSQKKSLQAVRCCGGGRGIDRY